MSKHKRFTKTKEWLYNEYVINNKTREELAAAADVSFATIKEYIRKWDIKKPKLVIVKDDLLKYIDDGLNTLQIAEKYQCDECTIFRYYKKFNIIERNKRIHEQYDAKNDKEIIELYEQGYSTIEIARKFNTTATTINYHLKHNNIELRDATECMWNYHKKDIPKDFEDYKKLYNLYIENHISKQELCRRYNCSIRIINHILEKHGIIKQEKPMLLTKFGKKLRAHFNILTPAVLKRDNYTCQLCGSHEKLQVHHIIPFKILFHNFLEKHPDMNIENNFNELFLLGVQDADMNNTDNLITYCKKCHMYKIHNFGK